MWLSSLNVISRRDNNIIKNHKILQNAKWNIEKEKDFLINYILKMSNFYRLPKVHKSKDIKIAVERQKSELKFQTLATSNLDLLKQDHHVLPRDSPN